jgi:CDP-diglyceride synthetase
MELAIQKLAIISFFVIGLSHIFQPRVWAQFFIDLRSKGEVGSFINAFIHFPLGALVVAFHNVWQGIPTILTIMGYGWVLKGLIYFVFPSFGLKFMSRVSLEKSWEFIIAGIVLVSIGGLLLFSVISKT